MSEDSTKTDDKIFNIVIRDIDDNVRHNHTARYSYEFIQLKGYNEQALIIKTIDELRAKIMKQFAITDEMLGIKKDTITKEAALKLTGWVEHDIENSSNLMSARYNEIDGLLDVTFKNGTEYRYKGVPVTVYEELKKTESAGKFLNQVIKGKYEFEKLEDDGE